jgi:hypothetical protein
MLYGGEDGNSRSQEDMLCPDSEALSQFRVRDLDKRVIGRIMKDNGKRKVLPL